MLGPILAVGLTLLPSAADKPLAPVSAEFARGYCAGYNAAAQGSRQNVVRFQQMLTVRGKPKTLPDETAKTISDALPLWVETPGLPAGVTIHDYTHGWSLKCPTDTPPPELPKP